jgi:hypothetical protein
VTSKNSDTEQRRATQNNARQRSSATQTATQDTPAQRSPSTGHAAPWQPCEARVTGLEPRRSCHREKRQPPTSRELAAAQPALRPLYCAGDARNVRLCREQCIENSSPTTATRVLRSACARRRRRGARWSVGDCSGQAISSGGVSGLPADIAHQRTSPLAVCPPYELWHRGDVTLHRDEAATRLVGRTARLRDVRCPRSRIVRCHSSKNGPVRVPKRGVLRRMQVADVPHKWLYEPDEDPKRKHHWNQDKARICDSRRNFCR